MSLVIGTALIRVLPSTMGFSSALSSGLSKEARSFQRAGDAMSLAVSGPIIAAFAGAANQAIKFESAFAGVRKTVNATEGEFTKLKDGIVNMANRMPATREQIAGVVEAAGRFGVANEDLLSFTETAVKLGVSTNLSADQAAESLTRLANIIHLPGDQFSNLASTIVALGNDFPTTESEIANFAKRLAGAGSVVGASTADIVGLSAALPSLGLRQEAAGTAFTRVMLNMQSAVIGGGDDLKKMAKIAGVSANEFATAFRTNPVQAIVTFIGGIKRLQDSGGDVAKTLKDVGLGEIRVRDSLLRSAQNVDLLQRALTTANGAWKDNNALNIEAEKRFKTTASQMQIFKNNVSNIGRILGETLLPQINKMFEIMKPFLDLLKAMADGYAKLPGPLQTAITSTLLFVAAIGPLISIGTRLFHAFQLIASGISIVTTMLAANPIVLVLLAIAAAGYLIYRNWDTLSKLWKDKVAPAVESGAKAVGTAVTSAGNVAVKVADKVSRFSLTDAIFGKKGEGADKAKLVASTATKAADQYRAAAEKAFAAGDIAAGEDFAAKAAENIEAAKAAGKAYDELSRSRSGGLVGQAKDFGRSFLDMGWEDQAAGITGSVGGALGQALQDALGVARNAVTGAAGEVGSFVANTIVGSITSAGGTVVGTMAGWGSTIAGAFVTAFQAVMGVIPGWISDLFSIIGSVFQIGLSVITAVWSAALAFIGPIVQAIVDAIVVRFQFLQAVLPVIWNALWAAIQFAFQQFTAIFGQLWLQFQGVIDIGVNVVSAIFNRLWQVIQMVWDQILLQISGAIDFMGSLFDRASGPIEGLIGTFQWFFDTGTTIWGEIMNGIGAFAGWVVDKIAWMAGEVAKHVDRMLGPLDDVAGFFGNIAGGAVSFATGGFLRRASGGSVLAGKEYIVGERGPELLRMGAQSGRIYPNSMMQGGSPVYNAPIVYIGQVMVDPRGRSTVDVSRDLARDTEKAMRANGTIWSASSKAPVR